MATITKTVIGTSPEPIDICKGFALFPGVNVRAGLSEGGQESTWLNIAPQILLWRLGVGAGWNLFAGMCGPAYAIAFDAEGETTGSSVQLAITNDHVQAGFEFGLTFGAHVDLTLQQDTPHWVWDGWHSHFADDWHTTFNDQLGFKFDLINLLFTYILKLLSADGKSGALQKVNTWTPSLLGAFSLFDDKTSQFAPNRGTWSVNPTFTLPINLVPLTIELPPPGDALALLNDALQPFLGYVRAGPTVGLSVPVTIRMTHITVDDQIYQNLEFSGQTVTGTGGTATATPTMVGVHLEHRPGFDLTTGLFFAIGVLKLFNLSASSAVMDLSRLLGITIQLGPYSNSLASPIGGVPHAPDVHAHVSETAPLEVVFEPAAIET